MKRVEVVSDPEVMSGEPCIKGTRIAVETVILNLQSGYPPERILAAYPTLPVGSIEAAIRWAGRMVSSGGRRTPVSGPLSAQERTCA